MKSFACTLSNKHQWQSRVEEWLAKSGIDHRQLSIHIGKNWACNSVVVGWSPAVLRPAEKRIYLNPRWRGMSIEQSKFVFFHELGHYKHKHTFNSHQNECLASNFALACGCQDYPPVRGEHKAFIDKRIRELDNPPNGVV